MTETFDEVLADLWKYVGDEKQRLKDMFTVVFAGGDETPFDRIRATRSTTAFVQYVTARGCNIPDTDANERLLKAIDQVILHKAFSDRLRAASKTTAPAPEVESQMPPLEPTTSTIIAWLSNLPRGELASVWFHAEHITRQNINLGFSWHEIIARYTASGSVVTFMRVIGNHPRKEQIIRIVHETAVKTSYMYNTLVHANCMQQALPQSTHDRTLGCLTKIPKAELDNVFMFFRLQTHFDWSELDASMVTTSKRAVQVFIQIVNENGVDEVLATDTLHTIAMEHSLSYRAHVENNAKTTDNREEQKQMVLDKTFERLVKLPNPELHRLLVHFRFGAGKEMTDWWRLNTSAAMTSKDTMQTFMDIIDRNRYEGNVVDDLHLIAMKHSPSYKNHVINNTMPAGSNENDDEADQIPSSREFVPTGLQVTTWLSTLGLDTVRYIFTKAQPVGMNDNKWNEIFEAPTSRGAVSVFKHIIADYRGQDATIKKLHSCAMAYSEMYRTHVDTNLSTERESGSLPACWGGKREQQSPKRPAPEPVPTTGSTSAASTSTLIAPALAPANTDEPPNEYNCPITGELMLDPVVAADGHSYERTAIEEWFTTGRHTSPKTNAAIDIRLVPNVQLRILIQEFRTRHA